MWAPGTLLLLDVDVQVSSARIGHDNPELAMGHATVNVVDNVFVGEVLEHSSLMLSLQLFLVGHAAERDLLANKEVSPLSHKNGCSKRALANHLHPLVSTCPSACRGAGAPLLLPRATASGTGSPGAMTIRHCLLLPSAVLPRVSFSDQLHTQKEGKKAQLCSVAFACCCEEKVVKRNGKTS